MVISFSFTGGIKCVKNLTLHTASVLSISASDHWLAIGAADNSMSLFHRPQERFGGFSNAGSKVAGWQLYRTPQKTAAVVCYHLNLHTLLYYKFSRSKIFLQYYWPARVTSSYVQPPIHTHTPFIPWQSSSAAGSQILMTFRKNVVYLRSPTMMLLGLFCTHYYCTESIVKGMMHILCLLIQLIQNWES